MNHPHHSSVIFPNEILQMILKHLSFRDLLEASLVSRQFYLTVISSRLYSLSTLYVSEYGIVSQPMYYTLQNQGIGLCKANLSRISYPLSKVADLNTCKSCISPLSLSLLASYLPCLVSLDMSFQNITYQVVETFVFGCPMVENVNFMGCLTLTPDAWILISHWKKLTSLNVSHTRMASLDGILLLAQTHSDLRELKLNCCVYIQCEQDWILLISSLLSNCKKLTFLDISHNILVSAQVLEPIYSFLSCNRSFTLDIRNCEQVTVSDIDRLRNKFDRMNILVRDSFFTYSNR